MAGGRFAGGGFGGEGYGIGASLASFGADQKRDALQELGNAADQESRRNQKNQQIQQSAKAGNVQLGSTVGATAGSAFGPWGTLLGGAIGAVAGGLFD